MAKSQAVTGLYLRHRVWWLRIVTPLELQPLNGGKRLAFHGTLETTDAGEARVKAMTKRTEVERLWHSQRRQLAPPKLATVPAPLRNVIAEAVYAAELAADESERLNKTQIGSRTSGVRVAYVEEDGTHPDGFVSKAIQQLYGSDTDAAPMSRLAPLSPAVRAARDALNARREKVVAGAVASGDLLAILPLAEAAAKHLGPLSTGRPPTAL